MPVASPVKFDVSDCTLREQSEDHLGWSADRGVYLVLRVPKRPPSWSFELSDLVSATAFFAQQCAGNGGVMLEMDKVQVAGRTALRGLFKYRSPVPQSMGMMFVHILWLPVGKGTAQVNVESVELGTTGGREAAVALIEGQGRGQVGATTPEPVMVGSVDEMLAHMRSRPLRALPCDDRRYDESFPDHPLSKVRRRMDQLMQTLTVVDEMPPKPEAPRAGPWWKFW